MQFSKLYKVKEGKKDIFKQWLAVLSTERKEEAIATFAHENITREVFVMFDGVDGDTYVAGFNEANGIIKKEIILSQSIKSIQKSNVNA